MDNQLNTKSSTMKTEKTINNSISNKFITIILIISPILAQCDWVVDGSLDVVDVVEMGGCILDDCFNGSQCDWNDDSAIDIIDVVAVVDCILVDCWQDYVFGCLESDAYNYNENAYYDDGSCVYPGELYLYFDNINEVSQSGEVWVIATNECAGFQLYLTGIILSDVFGGVEDEVLGTQFAYNSENGAVLEFTFGANFNPTGNYLLFNFSYSDITAPELCIFDPVFSQPPGSGSFDVIIEDCYTFQHIEGYTDPEAYNYDEFAIIDDGSCQFQQDFNVYFGEVDEDDQMVEIWVNSPGEIWGFQFDISGLFVTGAFGGVNDFPGVQIQTASDGVFLTNFFVNPLPSGNYLLTYFSYTDIIDPEICFEYALFMAPPGLPPYNVIVGECYTFVNNGDDND